MNRIKSITSNPIFWPALLITAGAVLRLWHLTTSPMWYDESFTSLVAGLPSLDRLMQAIAGDVHPPLYYLVVWATAQLFGNTVFVLRLISVIVSIAGLIMFHRLTGLMELNRPARIIALAIMALHPVCIFYAQEGRMYALVQTLVIMQLICLVIRDWRSLIGCTVLVLYTHNFGLIYTALIGLAGLAREYRSGRSVWPVVISLFSAGLLWLPWSLLLLYQMSTIGDVYWIQPVTVGSVIAALVEILTGFHVPGILIPLSVVNLFIGLVLLIIHGIQQRRYTLLLLAVGPVVLAVIASFIWRPILLFRALIGMIAPLALLAGDAVARSTKNGRVIAVALMLPFAIATIAQADAAAAGEIKITQQYTPPPAEAGVPVIHLDDTTMVLSQDPSVNFLLDAGCPEERGALTNRTRAAFGFQTIKIEDLPETYYLAGQLTALSTSCHEEVLRNLTAKSYVVYHDEKGLGELGVWKITNP